MFGWLKNWTGGARETDAPLEIHQAPVLESGIDDASVRISASLLFHKPANIDPFETLFGIVRLSRKDDAWPTLNGVPLAPLLQINLSRAPIIPAVMRDLALVTIFISNAHSSSPTKIIDSRTPDAHATWALRSYAVLDDLTIPKPPVNRNRIVPLLGEWGALREERRHDDAHDEAAQVPVNDAINHYERPHVPRPLTKLGGWPQFSRSAPWWADPSLQDTWDFVMQIENEPEAGWAGWGDGAAYIARSRQRPHLWAIDVQQI